MNVFLMTFSFGCNRENEGLTKWIRRCTADVILVGDGLPASWLGKHPELHQKGGTKKHELFRPSFHQTFQVPKWRNPHLYKLYGYGLCNGNPTPRIAEHKAQETLHFRYLKLLLIFGGDWTPNPPQHFGKWDVPLEGTELWCLVTKV